MSSPVKEPLCTWRGKVAHDWVDYNGHLRDAYYMVIFSFASDGLMDLIGMDAQGRQATGHTLYTLETHLSYLLEVKEGADVEVFTHIVGLDAKRLHLCHGLYLQGGAALLAANEQMLINIDTARARSAAFAPQAGERLRAMAQPHLALPRPSYAGRSIALTPPKPVAPHG